MTKPAAQDLLGSFDKDIRARGQDLETKFRESGSRREIQKKIPELLSEIFTFLQTNKIHELHESKDRMKGWAMLLIRASDNIPLKFDPPSSRDPKVWMKWVSQQSLQTEG